MKIKSILFTGLLSLAAGSCDKTPGPYAPIGGEALWVRASAEDITLTQEDEDKEVVTFTWNKGYEYTDAVSVEYCFKIDIAYNDFATATTLEVLGPDVFEKAMTAGELNDLCLERWNITPGESVMLEAKVIARLAADKFIMPEVAVTSFTVRTYHLPSSPLYILGDAVSQIGDTDPSKAILMTEEVPSRQYSYKGRFSAGSYMFIEQNTSVLPGWFDAGDGSTMLYCTESQGTPFSITKEATYKMVVNKRMKTLDVIYYPKFENIYMVGDASPGGWEISDAYPLTWIEGTAEFVYEGIMKAGNFKFAAGEKSWESSFYMAPSDGCSDLGITSMQYVEPGGVDYKWVMTEANAGNWRITLDIDALTIRFEKI